MCSCVHGNGCAEASQALARLAALEGEVKLLRELVIATANVSRVQGDQMDEIEKRDEELLYHKFTSRHFSEILFDVKIQYEVEVARIRHFGSVILDLVTLLPQQAREDLERRIKARPPNVGRRGKRVGRSREVRL